MIYSLQQESYDESIEGIEKYLAAHGAEVEEMEVTPKLDTYQDATNLIIYTMRCDDELVGYAAFWISEHPHHEGKVFAMNDLVYVHPDHRGEMALKFFEYIDKQLKICDAITYTFKVTADHPELMEYLEYQHTEKVYTKVNK